VIVNIGNTCYINLIIQLVIHSKNLLVYLVQILEDKYFINLIIMIIMLGQYYLKD
jgi:ubiquitin C-terminal hydrolase